MTAIEIYKLLKSQAEAVAEVADLNPFVNKNHDNQNQYEVTYIEIKGSHLFLELLAEVLVEKDDELITAIKAKVDARLAEAKAAAQAEVDALLG